MARKKKALIRLSLLLLVSCGLFLSGCLELIRRPESRPLRTGAPDRGDLSSEVNVPNDGKRSNALSSRSRKRAKAQKAQVEQINKYALWCIEHGMWNEAHSHMEKALSQDSLSASLYNNLGIVYEHLGLHEKAAESYRKALEIDPDNEMYRFNQRHFERFQRVGRDTSRRTGPLPLYQEPQDERGATPRHRGRQTFLKGE